MPSSDRNGRDLMLAVVSAQFHIPHPAHPVTHLSPCSVQEPPPFSDEYFGEPGASSMKLDGQCAYFKPATDIYLIGDACAPHGNPVTEMRMHIRVGTSIALSMNVYGDRTWQRAIPFGAKPSSPAKFTRMPLRWERAFGGVAKNSSPYSPAFEPRNPIGCGFETDVDAAIGKPVPNIEDPDDLLTQLSDRPQPIGVGAIARHWEPRLRLAGSYGSTWQRSRAPLWPDDFNPEFFCAAPPYLRATPHLTGGELVVLDGFHPDGRLQFVLPTLRFSIVNHFANRAISTTSTLDGVLIECNDLRLTIYYRAAVLAPLSLVKHRKTVIQFASEPLGMAIL
ncbi:DUF2169 domain-containing protein [Ideonella sp. A 288]|uniref:DUF2169 family type VI secretion system accessory protein n=1 Tax=Ideonella sp. A 288 TaxID=1962181 RepID=UPI000B4AB040|nr:DUF2169 domain-containing protein [Ideonella sp. A 288]